jgi:hypothetical protein
MALATINIARCLQRRLQCLLVGVLACTTPSHAETTPYDENAVKAAFLYRFTGYMEWPKPSAQLRPGFTIAVLDAKPVAQELARLLQQRPIKDLPVHVQTIRAASEASEAQMLYIGADYSGNLATAIAAFAGRPVLIVTDHPRGLDDGSAVNFLLVDRHVRFEVSLPATELAGIKVSSQLLSVATRVRGSRLHLRTVCTPSHHYTHGQLRCSERVARS